MLGLRRKPKVEPIDLARYQAAVMPCIFCTEFPCTMDHTNPDMMHLDGVDWIDAPIPPKRHECWAQTVGYVNLFEMVQRCACGGMRVPGRFDYWFNRNQRTPQVASR